MPKYNVRILTPAWQDIERIADIHMSAVGPHSAESITDKLLDKITLLCIGRGRFHCDPVIMFYV